MNGRGQGRIEGSTEDRNGQITKNRTNQKQDRTKGREQD